MGVILLLSPPIGAVVEDVAQVAKRVDSLMVRPVTEVTLSTLLGLPGIRLTRLSIEQGD